MTAAMTCLAITASAGNDTPHWSLTWKKMQTTGPELELIGTLPTRTTHELGASDWSVGCRDARPGLRRFRQLQTLSERIGSNFGTYSERLGPLRKAERALRLRVDRPYRRRNAGRGGAAWINLGTAIPCTAPEKGLGSKIFTDEPTMKAWLKFVEIDRRPLPGQGTRMGNLERAQSRREPHELRCLCLAVVAYR